MDAVEAKETFFGSRSRRWVICLVGSWHASRVRYHLSPLLIGFTGTCTPLHQTPACFPTKAFQASLPFFLEIHGASIRLLYRSSNEKIHLETPSLLCIYSQPLIQVSRSLTICRDWVTRTMIVSFNNHLDTSLPIDLLPLINPPTLIPFSVSSVSTSSSLRFVISFPLQTPTNLYTYTLTIINHVFIQLYYTLQWHCFLYRPIVRVSRGSLF